MEEQTFTFTGIPMRKCNTKFQSKRSSGRAVATVHGGRDYCAMTHSTVNDKHWQLYANELLYKLLVRAGV